MSDKVILIKNKEYYNAVSKYSNCVNINFENLKRDHIKFDQFINSNEGRNLCKNYIDEIKKIVNEGGLDYDNLI
jgi:hypothetical protein